MKMRNLNFFAMLVGAIMFATSCDKDVESTSLKVDLKNTSTVQGYVYADLDRTSAGLEVAPSDKAILILSVDYADLDPTLASTGKWRDTVRIDNSGRFTAKVPVADKTITLKIDPQPFETNQTYFDGSSLNATEKKIFSAPTQIVTLSTSVNDIPQVVYTTTGYMNTVEMVTLTLKVEAEYNETVIGFDIAAAQDIILSANGWAKKLNTDSNGQVTVKVPADESIYFTTNFTHSVKLANGNNETRIFKNDKMYIGSSTVGFINPVQLFGSK